MNPLDQIIDLADTLTEPHAHREPYTVWTGSRHRQTRHHITVQHGLLTQLHHAVLPATMADEGASGSTPGSRPPLEIEALSRHTQITTAATTWCKTLHIDPRATPESDIRALVGSAGHLDDTQQRALAADLRRWTHWCRVYLGLEQVRQITGVPCPLPDCTGHGTLRINLTTSHGLCTACGATWGTTTIGLLAEHITTNRSEKASA
jgi:hypothetical protein